MNKLLDKATARTISRLLFPLLICGLVQQIYEILNGVIAGKGLGNEALAIVGGVSISIFNTFLNLSSGIRTAGMTLISKDYASDNHSSFVSTIKKSLFISISISCLFALFCNLFGYPLLQLLKVPEDILPQTYTYLRIYAIGFIPNSISLMIINSFRAIGEGKRPSIMLTFTYVINLCVDCIVVLLLKLNTNYLAVSYVLTQTFVAIVLFYLLNKEYNILQSESTGSTTIGKILAIGIPIGLTSSFYAVTTIYMNAAINALGTEVISSYSIYCKVENIYWMIINALAIAMNTMFSMSYGRKDFEGIKSSFKFLVVLNIVLTAGYGLSIYLLSDVLPPFFTDSAITISVASSALRFMAPLFLSYGPLEVFCSLKNGLGKTVVPTYLALIGICGVRIGYLMFAPDLSTLNSIILAFPLSWGTNMILNAVYSTYLLKTME